MRLSLLVVVAAAVLLVAYRPATPASAAPSLASADSTEWENLQILPDTISHDALIGMMRGFNDALGVQCSFCHVRENGEMNFPSDAKSHKNVARGMMRMTWQINREILPAIDGVDAHGAPAVTCWTCHRGAAHPASAADTSDAHDGH